MGRPGPRPTASPPEIAVAVSRATRDELTLRIAGDFDGLTLEGARLGGSEQEHELDAVTDDQVATAVGCVLKLPPEARWRRIQELPSASRRDLLSYRPSLEVAELSVPLGAGRVDAQFVQVLAPPREGRRDIRSETGLRQGRRIDRVEPDRSSVGRLREVPTVLGGNDEAELVLLAETRLPESFARNMSVRAVEYARRSVLLDAVALDVPVAAPRPERRVRSSAARAP